MRDIELAKLAEQKNREAPRRPEQNFWDYCWPTPSQNLAFYDGGVPQATATTTTARKVVYD